MKKKIEYAELLIDDLYDYRNIEQKASKELITFNIEEVVKEIVSILDERCQMKESRFRIVYENLIDKSIIADANKFR